MKSNWLRGGTAPKIAKSGVRNGALTRAQRIRNIELERIRRERRGNAAEVLGEARREIEQNKIKREQVRREREAVGAAIEQSQGEFPDAKMKIKRDKSGAVVIQRRNKGKFIAPVKVAAGFTLTEIAALLTTIFALLIVGGLFYVAFHFISKFW